MANRYNIEYAISLGKLSADGLWIMKFIHPLDANSIETAYIAQDIQDARIGTVIEGVKVAKPEARMLEALKWLNEKISSYPYYWQWEGTYVDKYGYDFNAAMNVTQKNQVDSIELTLAAYEIVKSKLDIKPPVDEPQVVENEVIRAGGAYVKFTVTMDRQKPVSEITIAPFANRPLEIVSITYEEDIETFHPRKELLLQDVTMEGGVKYVEPKESNASTESITFKFPAVTARRFTFIMRQKNFVKNTYLVRKKDVNRKDLWDKISEREADVTLDLHDNGVEVVEEDKISGWTGWDIYMQQLEQHKKDHTQWLNEVRIYREKMIERKAAIDNQNKEKHRYSVASSKYREELDAAKKKYNKRVDQYNKEVAAYESAKKKHDEEVVLYNKSLKALKDWENKWG